MKIPVLFILCSTLFFFSAQGEEAPTKTRSTRTTKNILPARASQEKAPPKNKNINVGTNYRSKYYWRGQWFYGASAGVFFPYISYVENNVYLYLGAEIGENLLFDESESNESGFGEVEKDWQGLDFGAVKTFELSEELLDLSLGAWYFWYFNSPEIGNDGIDNSFADLRVSLSFKSLPLAPSLTYSHYFRSDESYAQRTEEDYYITLAVSQNFTLDPNTTFTVAGDINYWHYASKEESPLYGKSGEIPSGLSDAVLKGLVLWTLGQTKVSAGLNYGHIFDEKFDYTEGDSFDKNKFWSTLGVEKTF